MRAPRVTLGGIMAAVVVVAANLAAARALDRLDGEALLCVLLPALLLQVALWRAWSDRRPGRGFCVGYVLIGSAVSASLVWGFAHPDRYAPPAGGAGPWVLKERGSWHYRLWMDYIVTVVDGLHWSVTRSFPGIASGVAEVLAVAGLWAPQVLGGVLGGLAGRVVSRPRRRAGGPVP
jgi:hypothetical protein